MSEKASTFGSKVIGEEAAARAVAAEKGGGNVFGKRVVDAIHEPSADYIAKKNSEFGAKIIGGASEQDAQGKRGSVSIKDLESILEENPTTFDSLYEGELARAEGPRKEALEIFAVVEYGIKGAGRMSVINEINALLGKNTVNAAAKGDRIRAFAKQGAEQAAREADNVKIADAPRVRALVQREEDLALLGKSKNRGVLSQVPSADVDAQLRSISTRDGLASTEGPVVKKTAKRSAKSRRKAAAARKARARAAKKSATA